LIFFKTKDFSKFLSKPFMQKIITDEINTISTNPTINKRSLNESNKIIFEVSFRKG
jgi:hypothetical protein